MSDTSSLTELARFIGRSALASEDAVHRRRALNAMTNRLLPARPQRKKVGELLAVVMALSARTRRAIMPKVAIELDVFAPGGKRAVLVTLPGSKD